MQEIITITIVAACTVLLVLMGIRKLRRKGCGCGKEDDCTNPSAICGGCPLVDNCSQKDLKKK